jgi:NAD(P)-dependent dehydrogenase (short-subunit alcohol dehydrogenase family)
VTGSSRGIGSATVRLLASQGAKVAINYVKSESRAQRVKEMIDRDGGVAEVFQADVTDADDVKRLVDGVRTKFGAIDVLVANAAIGFKMASFLQYNWEDFELKLTNELKSIFYLCKDIVPEMIERRSGSIVAVSSSMSKISGGGGFIAHSSAKAALDSFIRGLATELGPDGIRVNTVAPGFTLTDASANLPYQRKDAAASLSPLRRNGLPRDVAGAVLFFASDLSQFITGNYLPVDGGLTML